jgi:hypothetical protein
MSSTAKRYGPFAIVQPSHIRAAVARMPQEDRLIRLKQDARSSDVCNLLTRRASSASPRRFSGEPITVLGAL